MTGQDQQQLIEQLQARIKELELAANDRNIESVDAETDKIPVNQKLKSRDYSTTKYVPKNPSGMKDYTPEEMFVREKVMTSIRNVFKTHGAVEIETPVVELKETLSGKYGEDSKLIYDLKDQGGEILALRYDLTVPFARYCAQHNVDNLKRFHIARVYRRDKPVMSKGRFREFYQCDVDIAGDHESMCPDAECLKIVSDCLKTLEIPFKIKINHRKILDGIFQVCGVKEDYLRPICSAVDKLDKLPWEEVKEEMLSKGLSSSEADMIWEYVQNSGGSDLVSRLKDDERLKANKNAMIGLEELGKLIEYLECFGLSVGNDQGCDVVLDLSLARGLDYYTGLIFEALALNQTSGDSEERVGSIAGGGRYDNLVGMFKKKGKSIPCVGLSLGIERLFVLYEAKLNEKKKVLPTQVLVCAVGARSEEREEILKERMRILKDLWSAGISAETMYRMNPKALTQFQFCETNVIPFAVTVAPGELAEGCVIVREIEAREETKVKISELVQHLKGKLLR